MRNNKVKVKIDRRALERVVTDGIKREGLDLTCPSCGEPFTMRSNPARCPRCGQEVHLS